jgi:hypothetical protein
MTCGDILPDEVLGRIADRLSAYGLHAKRSHEGTCGAGECIPIKRDRVASIFCNGTGLALPVSEAS